jgi:RNA polymerase sigma-70 factor (ECF subfamily)
MSYSESDKGLAARASKGDAAAFRLLLERYYDSVFRVAYGVLRDQTEAEDVTQEIWAAMPQKLKNWRGEAKLSTWLYRIAVNAAKDALRKKATRNRIKQSYAELQDLSRGEIADTKSRLNWLQTALDNLSEDLRDTAALTLGEEMNFAQAGEVLGVAEGTIAWRMSEIRKQLKALAQGDDGDRKAALL